MVKVVSLILFVAALIWTWFLFNSPAQMGTDVHAGIQSKLTILIEDTVKAKRPTMTNFRLLKMYTEKMDDNKVKAHFSYQYDDVLPNAEAQAIQETATQKISGEAILTKALSEDPDTQKWVLQSVKADNQNVEFKEGLSITSDGKDSEPNTEPASATTETH